MQAALAPSWLFAQTADDGFMMPKGEACAALVAQQNEWSEYWEGSLKRDNPNLGTVSMQAVMPMVNYGITDYLNIILAVPYIKTAASAGTLRGHRGFQDAAVWLKFKPVSFDVGKTKLAIQVLAGATTPASGYLPDYLPLSIGLGCQNLNTKAAAHWETPKGLFVTASGGYQYRTNTKVNRTNYYTDQGYTAEEARMPNWTEYKIALGYLKHHLKATAYYTGFNTLGGTDIRRNDMPFPSNNMDGTKIGGEVQVYLGQSKALSILAMGNKVLSGRNIGQSWMLGGGLAYQVRLLKK